MSIFNTDDPLPDDDEFSRDDYLRRLISSIGEEWADSDDPLPDDDEFEAPVSGELQYFAYLHNGRPRLVSTVHSELPNSAVWVDKYPRIMEFAKWIWQHPRPYEKMRGEVKQLEAMLMRILRKRRK
jgi:hypothetical protein